MSADECADERAHERADERADERAASNSSDVLEAIQNLPPDHLTMIYKDYVTMKQRER